MFFLLLIAAKNGSATSTASDADVKKSEALETPSPAPDVTEVPSVKGPEKESEPELSTDGTKSSDAEEKMETEEGTPKGRERKRQGAE